MGELKFKVWRLDKRKMYRIIRLSDSLYGECEEPYCHYEDEEGKAKFLPLSMGVILQYTGQDDRNGTGIYIGDFVLISHKERDYNTKSIFKIVIERHFFGFRVVWEHVTGYHCPTHILEDDFSNCVVIGNVYENPEL